MTASCRNRIETDAAPRAPSGPRWHGWWSFGGWEMPVSYAGIAAEHMAVRTAGGLFDVSHMGEVEIAGSGALAAVQRISCNDAAQTGGRPGAVLGAHHPGGHVPRRSARVQDGGRPFPAGHQRREHPSRTSPGSARRSLADGDTFAVNTSSRYALLALQGPRAQEILQPLTAVDLADLQYYRFTTGEVAAIRVTISRTGYTGEDGFELFAPPRMADRLWMALLDAGAPSGIQPAGLGCPRHAAAGGGNAPARQATSTRRRRCSRRASVGLSAGTSLPSTAGKPLLRQKHAGAARKLVGFEMLERGIARQGYPKYMLAAKRSGASRAARRRRFSTRPSAWPTCRSRRRRSTTRSPSTCADGNCARASCGCRSTNDPGADET